MKGDVIKYRRGYKYSLFETYVVQTNIVGYEINHHLFELTKLGVLTIHADYPWDGPSGPTLDTPDFMRGSLVHDVLYEMLRLGLLPQEAFTLANLELKTICLEDGMTQFRADYVYDGVEMFGHSACAVQPEHIILAP